MSHTFHIPVLGLGYSIDTPLKVAPLGIASVVSIVNDDLVARMHAFHAPQYGEAVEDPSRKDPERRAKRITAYLNFMQRAVKQRFEIIRREAFAPGTDLTRYFELLPESSVLRQGYDLMMEMPDGDDKRIFQNILREQMKPGEIDVNIMAKVDKINVDGKGNPLAEQFSDALAALRGFASSTLRSSIVLSAGMNPRLYSYMESFADFYPDEQHELKKRIILKVSDFRSAQIQARFLAKKGLWVSEFRIESGLNCGGHAFATDGYLAGPILEEFKQKRKELQDTLFQVYRQAITDRGYELPEAPRQHITYQGGIGTAGENEFLLRHYQLNATGWGSPFLLVPEVTNVDADTLLHLQEASETDFYTSHSSPLGILFNNFRSASMETQRLDRIAKGRPGSPCTQKYLVSNTEFTEQPICTASREYQALKIRQLEEQALPEEQFKAAFDQVTGKICLCEGLCASAYLKNDIVKRKESTAVSICPGPNIAYFNAEYTLQQMVDHIYGRVNLIAGTARPMLFMKELALYVDYFENELKSCIDEFNDKKRKYFSNFKSELNSGIAYYKGLAESISKEVREATFFSDSEISALESRLNAITW